MAGDPTLDELLAEERSLLLDRFDYAFAWELGCRIHDRAVEQHLPIAVEISQGAEPVFFALLPGATPHNHLWVRRKANAVLQFHHSSLYLRLQAERNGMDFNAGFRLPADEFAASGGGVPLVLRHGGLVGTAAVSGLPDVDDHGVIVSCLRTML